MDEGGFVDFLVIEDGGEDEEEAGEFDVERKEAGESEQKEDV